MGIFLSSSVGLGTPLDEVNGVIDGGDSYVWPVTDVAEPGKVFFNSGLDIDALYWGAIVDGGIWYTIGMTVTAPPINTTGDGMGIPPIPTMTTVKLSLSQLGVDQYLLQASMFADTVVGVYVIDRVTNTLVTVNPADIKYKVDTGLEIAIKQSYFSNLAPLTPFDFRLDFDGGGTNEDDSLQGRVPEPATMSMLVIGGLVTLVRRRRAKR